MARQIHKLTDVGIKSLTKKGRHSDGGGLYLRISGPTSKSWSFMWNSYGKRDELGLGSYPAISLASARRTAARYRELVAAGNNPRTENQKTAEPNFGECVALFLADMEGQWSNAKHRAQWRQTLGPDYCRKIENKRVSEINMHDVLSVLKPIWNEKNVTASRLRGRIERVLNFAKTKGWRDGENPAIWRGNLENVLPRSKAPQNNHLPAMPYHEVPDFVSRLNGYEALAARALELTIFTVCRTSEILKAQWQEFDLEVGLWTIPPDRMKARKEHIVPLTDAAVLVLSPLKENAISGWVFPGQKAGKPLSNMAMEMLLRRMNKKDVTVHGFRSSFRDWAGDETSFPREIAEGCLAHSIGNAVERAYRRSSAIEKRRELLDAWADYCQSAQLENAVKLHG